MPCINFENLHHGAYIGTGKYEIPVILPEEIDESAIRHTQIIPFNYALTEKNGDGKAVHFYIDDYQFQRVWKDPDRYIPVLQKFDFVISPDFSIYSDMPEAMRIYNHYRKHWLAAYWQEHGIKVIADVCWSDERSFEWCFDGEPQNQIVAVSSVGCMKTKEGRELFIRGYEEMMKRLNPLWVIAYGKIPDECDWNMIHIKPHQDSVAERRIAKWQKENPD